MASNKDPSPTDNKASIALLRRLRAGGDDVQFVHRIDVCAAPPEVLVADLEPVPGTGLDDDGYSRIWYFYHAKKYKNTRGDTSGHRQRAVTGGDGTAWHSEIGRKDVHGSGGGTFCTLSYGRKTEPSARSIDRMGWCMVEYDFVAADKKQDEAAAADSSNYVLCKVYRSPRAKGKSSALASSSSKNASSKHTAKKRKAGGAGEHPEAPPAKSIQQQQQEEYQPQADVQQPAEPGGDFNFNIEDINFYLDDECVKRADESEQGGQGLQQQPISEPKQHDVEFIRLPCGPVLPVVAEATVEDMLGPETTTIDVQLSQQRHEQGGEFIQMPFGQVVPVVAEATLEDMLGLGAGPGPETMNYGEWSGGMATTARIEFVMQSDVM
ncbi:hypothetical protein BDA96_01G019600 [Sorghum bicolor]|uniref:NAC domain-containing protein n=1 Tax=Sorghum bicolor TaxID=4558 RepID=A0A921RVJ6_SORBI|nr:hypothetical protein BDA96_01G019600 [Sorghum bicolor]